MHAIRNKVINTNSAKESLNNNLYILVYDFQNNDNHYFWKVIRYLIKNNHSATSIPPLFRTLSHCEKQGHFNDQDK